MRILTFVVFLFAFSPTASADDKVPSPAGWPDLSLPEPQGGLGGSARGIYLGSLDARGGAFAGFEVALGGWARLVGPLGVVVRGRIGSLPAVTVPAGELDDTMCSGGGLSLSLSWCTDDLDMLLLVGGELGARLEHRAVFSDIALSVGGELFASGTGYVHTFEHVREGGGLGAGGLLFLELQVRAQWTFGIEAGARIEAGIAGPDRMAAHAGLRLLLHP